MRNTLLVAKREYLEQIRGRAFRLTTILLPLLFVGLIGVGYLSGRGSGIGKHLVVASTDAALANDIVGQLATDKDAKTSVEMMAPAQAEDRAALVNRVKAKTIDGFLWIDATPGKVPTALYESQNSGDFITNARLSGALNRAVVRQRLTAQGIKGGDVDQLLKNIKIDTEQVTKEGKETKSNAAGSYIKGYIMAFLLSMTTMIYGLNVARSIIQEKTSRIFEVMLAIAKPSDLLAGKLIGVGAVGLTQIGIWAVAGAAIAAYPAALATLSGSLALHLSWTEGILFPIYFILGYLFYSSLFAGLAATCETEQELQMYTPLAAVPIWLSFSLIWLIVNDPNSVWSIAISLFPPTAPIVMFLRMGSEMPPLWQIGASIGLLMLSIWGLLWFSSRLYRVGILMYGKRATLPELIRWLRYS
jgi:ABC-2 type transport system permease protein